VDLGAVDRITADAVGEPGSRIFYIQARAGAELVTVIVEKQQVQLLAASVLQLLEETPDDLAAVEDDDPGMNLEEPLEARWRAGRLSIGLDQDRDLFLLEVEEYQPDAEELDVDDPFPGEPGAEPELIRLWASKQQMLALSRHGAAVAARGRPLCQFCGNPMDAEGHACPAMNGHSKPA
jgi:uncharacterized repeat protein (TIGR03847 family)